MNQNESDGVSPARDAPHPKGSWIPGNLLGQKLGARDRCQLDVWWALGPLGQLTEQGDWQMIFSGDYVT